MILADASKPCEKTSFISSTAVGYTARCRVQIRSPSAWLSVVVPPADAHAVVFASLSAAASGQPVTCCSM